MPEGEPITVLHYVGYDEDRGGILATVRALAAEQRFRCVLGVNPEFRAGRSAALPRAAFPRLAGDTIGLANAWRARRVAREVRTWLQADATRVFHGHSRAGLLVAWWLQAGGERRALATVHCYGRQRWFYRWAAGRLPGRVRWLTPSMKSYYGVGDATWDDCLPGCVNPADWPAAPRAAGAAPARRVTFGCAGGLVPVKQWELVLDGVREVAPAVPLRVVHAGGEDGSAASARYAADLRARSADLAERFEWRGPVRDMAAFYGELDCLLIASRHEGFSVAALEAGAAGVPVLAADAAGNRDLVHAARLGWLFPADSAAALGEGMQRLATSGELARWRRDEAAFQRFTAAASAAAHRALYERLLAER